MARRFKLDVPATTLSDLTAADGGMTGAKAGTYVLNLCNRSGANVTARVALTTTPGATSSDVVLADYLEFDMIIEPCGVLSRWPIPMAADWKLWLFASATGLSANFIGLEEA